MKATGFALLDAGCFDLFRDNPMLRDDAVWQLSLVCGAAHT